MSNPITNRYDFALVFDVCDGNPNGDPDAGNLPRIDPETGHGLVTDVCLKRKVRNYVQIMKEFIEPYDIYIKEKAILGLAHFKVFKDLGIITGEESSKPVPNALLAKIRQLSMPDGIFLRSNGDDDLKFVVALDVDKGKIKEWLKVEKPCSDISQFINSALKEVKPRRPKAEETARGRARMCQNFYDIRTFGAVLSLKSAPNCGQVRGPVQLTFGRSVDPIVTLEHCITRMAVATEAEAEKQKGDNRTMGRKNTIPYGVYISHGFVSAHLAAQTGFNDDDLTLLWDALTNMFEHDRSAARGMMATRKLIIFKHDSALGNASAHSLFDKISIEKNVDVPRSWKDYDLHVPSQDDMPDDVTIECRL